MPTTQPPQQQLDSFIDKFTPDIAKLARTILEKMRKQYPTALQLVYDNYNALAVGFGPSDKASEAILSIAVYPFYVSLFFLNGVKLSDPHQLLEGKGSKVRHIKLRPNSRLENSEVIALMDVAVANAHVPLPTHGVGDLVIKSISAKQRPRTVG